MQNAPMSDLGESAFFAAFFLTVQFEQCSYFVLQRQNLEPKRMKDSHFRIQISSRPKDETNF
jgi:hypothetical protein